MQGYKLNDSQTSYPLNEVVKRVKEEVDQYWKINFFDNKVDINEILLLLTIYVFHLKDKYGVLLRKDLTEEFEFSYSNDGEIIVHTKKDPDEDLWQKRDIFLNFVLEGEDYNFSREHEHSNFYKFLNPFNIQTTKGFKSEQDGYITTNLAYALAYLYKRKQVENRSKKQFLKKYKGGKLSKITYEEYELFFNEFREFLLNREFYGKQLRSFSPYSVGNNDDWTDVIKTEANKSGEGPTLDERCEIEFQMERTLKFRQFIYLSVLRKKFRLAKMCEELQQKVFTILFMQIDYLDCIYNLLILKSLISPRVEATFNRVKDCISNMEEINAYLTRVYEECTEEIESTSDIVLNVEEKCLKECQEFILNILNSENPEINKDFLKKDFKYILTSYADFLEKERGIEI